MTEVTEKKTNSAEDDPYLPAARVWGRYGVSAMSLHRWLHDPKMKFPKPLYIGRYRYWRLSDLTAWERTRAGRAA
jgi:predicted DNA-binding transcriptional regulator AlpA